MLRTTLVLVVLLMSIIPSKSFARGDVYVGDTIPHNLELFDQNGQMQSFSKLTGKKGIVLAFVRSVDWCPYCQKQLIDLDKSAKRFEEFGYNLVSVSYDSIEAMRKFVTENNPTMTLLSDPRSESIRAFSILNEDVAKGTVSYGVPYPVVYVIGKDKKVQAKFFEEEYKDRPSTAKILTKIEELNPPELPPMTVETMGTDPIEPGEEYIEIPTEELPPLVLPGVDNNGISMDPQVDDDALLLNGEAVNNSTQQEFVEESVPPVLPKEQNMSEPSKPLQKIIDESVVVQPETQSDLPVAIEPIVNEDEPQEFLEDSLETIEDGIESNGSVDNEFNVM